MTAPYLGTQTAVPGPNYDRAGNTVTTPTHSGPGGGPTDTPGTLTPQPPGGPPGVPPSQPTNTNPVNGSGDFRTMTPTSITGTNVAQPPSFNPQTANFAQLLASLFNNYQQPQQAPQWTPGQNPFSGGFNPGTVGAPGTPQNMSGFFNPSQVNAQYTPQNMNSAFTPGQFNGNAQTGRQFNGAFSAVNAPGVQLTAPVTSAQNPLGWSLQQTLAQQLQNPSAFGAPQAQQAYNYLSQGIDDQFKQKQALTEEEMARRGLHDSSIAGGRLSDLNVAQKSAQEDLANNILMQQAQTLGSDRNAAIQSAMGYGGQQFGQNLATQQQQAAVNDQNFQQELAQAAFQGDQNAQQVLQSLNIQGFNNQVGQQNFQNQLQTQGFNNQAGQQGFQNLLTQLGFNNANQQQGFENAFTQGGFNNQAGQQGFQNQMSQLGFNNANQQQSFQNLLAQMGFNNQAGQQGFQNQYNVWQGNNNQANQNYQNQLQGYGAGLAGNQQGFNQEQQLLANMLGYNQQDFQNQQSTWQDNQGAQEWYQQLMAMLARQGAA